jgi:two-component system OmpR family sensor kinase
MPARGQHGRAGPTSRPGLTRPNGPAGRDSWLSRPPRWLAGRTLRGRLVAGLLATLTVACAAVGAVTYAHLHGVLIVQLDEQLKAASMRYAGCMRPPPGHHDDDGDSKAPPDLPSMCAQQQGAGTFSAIGQTTTTSYPSRAGHLRQPFRAGDPGYCKLTAADLGELGRLPVNGGARTVTLSSYGPYRLMASSTNDGSVFVSGLPLAPVNDTLQQIAVAEIVVFSIALVLTGLIGTAWVRVSLRPLRRVAATATRVTELPLASGEVAMPERVPDSNPATEVGQVGAAFNHMLGHVESALARRAASEARLRRFAADASHELRTPLAAIRGYAELARRHPGPVPDDVAHALSRVESESARMSVLVDELLLLAQLDAGRPLASEPVDLTRLAIDVTSDARAAAPGHWWRLDLPDEPVLVRGDEHRLHQVLANLLSNAGRHTPAGTTVTLALATAIPPARRGQPAAVQVTVTDDGPGIPADLQPAMFERFVRGDTSRSHVAGSTGLGLAIVDAVTAAHHGTVEVTSRPGRTRFTITLPRLAAEAG